MNGIQSLFWPVLLVVTGLSLVAAVVALAHSGRHWDDFGRNLFVGDREGATGSAAGESAQERDEEIRELLRARNDRRRRRGEPEVDVEAELGRLIAPQIDDALRAEIRDLVVARNARRARAGKPPLDVEAEIAREIEGLRELT